MRGGLALGLHRRLRGGPKSREVDETGRGEASPGSLVSPCGARPCHETAVTGSARLLVLLAAIALSLSFQACEEHESTLGGLPGGQVISLRDTVTTHSLLGFHRSQEMVAASRQTVGRSDSLGLESVLILRFDYQPIYGQAATPADTPSVHLSFKMDHSPGLVWFPQRSTTEPDPGESANYLDLELILLRDSLGYDGLGWEDAFTGGDLHLAVQERITFRVSDADTLFGDSESGGPYTDPLTGRRTFRNVPASWFAAADTSTRWLMLRALPGQQGFMPLLAAGHAGELRPRLRFARLFVDSVDVGGGVWQPDSSRDTTYVSAAWQSSLIRDAAAPARLTLSTGWAAQALLELPAFPPDPEDPRYDPLGSTLVEAWLRVPLEGRGFNAVGAKVNLYAVGADDFDSTGVDLDSDQLVASEVVEDTTSTLAFNLTPHLRRVWVNDDTLRNTDPIVLALKLDDYNLLQLRQLGLADPLLHPCRLVVSLSQAPATWGQP